MSDRAFQLPLPTAGVRQDRNASELAFNELEDAENWVYEAGEIRVRRGVSPIGATTSDRPNGFYGYIDDSGDPVLLMGTDDSVFVFNDTDQDWDDLSAGFTAGPSASTVFEAFLTGDTSDPDTVVYIQNGVDVAKKWTLGDVTVTSVPSIPVAKAQMLLADRLIVGHIVSNGSSTYTGDIGSTVAAVSANLDPESGYDGADGQIISFADTPGAIVAMAEIGNLQGAVYKTDAIYIMSVSIEEPFTVSLKKSYPNLGPVSPRVLVVAPDGLHYYLAADGNVMVFDGIDPKPLPEHIQRYILNTWDIDTAHKAHGIYDDERRTLTFFYPGVGSAEPNRRVTIRLDDMTLWPSRYADLRFTASIKASLPGGTTIGQLVGTVGDQDLTLGEYDALGQRLLFGEFGGLAYVEDGTLDDTAAIQAFFDTGHTDLGDPLRFKSMRYIDHLYTRAGGDQEVDITLRGSNYGENLEDESPRTIEIGDAGPYKTFHRFPKRTYALRVAADATEEVVYQGATAVYALQGKR